MIPKNLIFLFLVDTLGYIISDTGYFTNFDYEKTQSFGCYNSFHTISTITFSGIFANTPKVILTIEKLDQKYQPTNTTFDILSITTSQFKLFVQCYEAQLVGTRLRWFAIDNENIQVINHFNDVTHENFTIPHSNPNALAGFISIVSLSYSGPLNFYVNISKINFSSVSIEINDPNNRNSNLVKLSFQIILAPPEYINLVRTLNLTSNYNSFDIPVIENTYFMIPTQGYIYEQTQNIRLNVTYNSLDPISYSLHCWYQGFIQNMNSQIQLYYKIITPKIFLPLKCSHIRTSKKFDPVAPTKPIIVKVLETNTIFSIVGDYTISIDKSITTINLSIQFQCYVGKKIQSSFFMNPANIGQQQMKTQYHFCYGEGNLVTYYPRFIQQMTASEEIIISISSTSCLITQVLYNQEKSQVNLLSLIMVDV